MRGAFFYSAFSCNDSEYIGNIQIRISKQMLDQQEQQELDELTQSQTFLDEKEKDEEHEEESPLKMSYCSQSPTARSTYYQTNYSNSIIISPLKKKWISPPHPSIARRTVFSRNSSIFKGKERDDQLGRESFSPRKIGQRQNQHPINNEKHFLFRINKIQTPLFDLRPCVTASSYYTTWSDTLEPLLGSNETNQRQIASLTKIMTAYTVLSICQQYNIKVREHWIPIHTRASYMEGTSANLRSGEEILLIDLFYGLLLPSGNDAGTAMAQYFGKFLSFKLTKETSMDNSHPNLQQFNECKGYYDQQYERQSIKLFVFEMNRQAQLLGLSSTHFDNPTGLTNQMNYSTAKDMAHLTSVCLKNHLLRLVFKKKVHKCEVKNDKLGYNREVMWQNTNKHLYKIRQCIGVKTGITPGAGPCLSAAYKIGNRQLIVVVLNCQDRESRYEDLQKIYRWVRRQTMTK